MASVDSTENQIMSGRDRVLIGALGGLSAILVKYVSQDHNSVLQFFDANLPVTKLYVLLASYSILAPITLVLGGIIGWISDEQNRLKLFALGVSAPALITTGFGGDSLRPRSQQGMVEIMAPSSAYAQFGGIGDAVYVVQIGSFTQRELAQDLMNKVNTNDRTVRAFVTDFKNDQGVAFFRVQVLQMLSLKDALALRERVIKTGLSKDANVVEVR